jgi:hypothetical protein
MTLNEIGEMPDIRCMVMADMTFDNTAIRTSFTKRVRRVENALLTCREFLVTMTTARRAIKRHFLPSVPVNTQLIRALQANLACRPFCLTLRVDLVRESFKSPCNYSDREMAVYHVIRTIPGSLP